MIIFTGCNEKNKHSVTKQILSRKVYKLLKTDTYYIIVCKVFYKFSSTYQVADTAGNILSLEFGLYILRNTRNVLFVTNQRYEHQFHKVERVVLGCCPLPNSKLRSALTATNAQRDASLNFSAGLRPSGTEAAAATPHIPS